MFFLVSSSHKLFTLRICHSDLSHASTDSCHEIVVLWAACFPPKNYDERVTQAEMKLKISFEAGSYLGLNNHLLNLRASVISWNCVYKEMFVWKVRDIFHDFRCSCEHQRRLNIKNWKIISTNENESFAKLHQKSKKMLAAASIELFFF